MSSLLTFLNPQLIKYVLAVSWNGPVAVLSHFVMISGSYSMTPGNCNVPSKGDYKFVNFNNPGSVI
jgi:hypothetical protein